jgi:hypothetical protein
MTEPNTARATSVDIQGVTYPVRWMSRQNDWWCWIPGHHFLETVYEHNGPSRHRQSTISSSMDELLRKAERMDLVA